MRESFEFFKQDLDDLVDKWDKALKSDIFKDAPKPATTSKQTSDDSFFGLQQTHPTKDIPSSDVDYWRAIDSVADGGVDFQRLDEVEQSIPPNPLRRGIEGEDQKLEPHQLGNTFDEEDIKKLEDLKLKLHDLGSKAAEMKDKTYESEIKNILDKVEELSNKMCGVEK